MFQVSGWAFVTLFISWVIVFCLFIHWVKKYELLESQYKHLEFMSKWQSYRTCNNCKKKYESFQSRAFYDPDIEKTREEMRKKRKEKCRGCIFFEKSNDMGAIIESCAFDKNSTFEESNAEIYRSSTCANKMTLEEARSFREREIE
ncbi:MAG: hypothetical protein IJB34_00060 [Clostridia bacterium]|nr:hypothetical protein [Clostridia bacterium]